MYVRRGLLCLFLIGFSRAYSQPVITTQPQDQEVPFGGSTTFWVQANGTGSLRYQWYFNSPVNPIPGGTNVTLILTNVQNSNAGSYRVRVMDATGSAWSSTVRLSLFSRGLPAFGTILLPPAFELNGTGTDVDSIAFWEAPDPGDTLMIVTAKGNNLLEVYRHPFQGNELAPRLFLSNVNGVAVDQETDRLYVSDQIVSVLSLPNLALQGEFGQGIIGVGENNLDILKLANGQKIIYVSDDHLVHRFDSVSWNHLGAFAPPVVSIETVLADDFYQRVLVPEEQGAEGNTGVFAYQPDGTPFEMNGTNRFGNNLEFDSDEEGILLYTFPTSGTEDNGTGFIVVADQKSTVTDFEFFDRQTWAHLGRLQIQGVSNTDGIASTQLAMPNHPMGLFAAINNDTSTIGLGWDVIFNAIGVNFLPRVLSITPETTGPTSADAITFDIQFSKPVTNFNESADLIITHFGTAHSGAVISGNGAAYQISVSGITGEGLVLMAVSTNSDVRDFTTNALASSVTSLPVLIQTPYHAWAVANGLVLGVNAAFAEDPDDDSRSNGLEFATDGDPLDNAPDGKQRLANEDIGGATYFTYTVPVRIGATFLEGEELSATVDGIIYSLAGSLDLVEFSEQVAEIVPALDSGLPTLHAGWSYRSFRLNETVSGQSPAFIRLTVSSEH